ncbi:MAG: ABC transporter substrate-binding protein [Hyphomicrobiaceae bacterium]|nr:ABC transporter substrate-binding protein [Hyphomicrobiaceae bacterium]
MRARFSRVQLRDLLFIAVPALIAIIGAGWLALRFADPPPPGTFVISAATKGSPYYRFAEGYRPLFERNGVKLDVRESAGSFANLKALLDPASGVHAAFMQGGLAASKDAPGVLSIGGIAYEPLWVFHSASLRIERLSELKGKRILVGPANSGTAGLALRLLAVNGVTAETATLINSELPQYVDKLSNGQADAGFLVLAAEAQTIQRLLRVPNITLMSFVNAEAYTQRFPFLTPLLLHEGVVDFAANVPPTDIVLLATTATVLVREDAHRALVTLLTEAVQEAHAAPVVDANGEAPLFQPPGVFPIAADPEFPFSEEARRVYRSGPPFLQRYVPFWVAATIDRLAVSLVVLVPILIPLVRFAPQLYSWRVRRRILYWYGALKRLEAAARRATSADAREQHLAELARIEEAVDDIPIPLAFSDKLYELRQHIEVVRRRLTGGAYAMGAAMAAQ